MFTAPVFAQSFQWAKQAGGTGLDEGTSICADAAGNSYVVGKFSDMAVFGSFTLTPTPSINDFSTDAVFMAKYDPDGKEVWAIKLSDSNLDAGNDIAMDSSGNLYVTGSFSGTVNFGSSTLVSNGFGDMFVAKYDENGNFIWARKGGGSSFSTGRSLALDGASNCYVTGYFRAGATFGTVTLTSKGRDDVFVVKYDQNGTVLWARSAGGDSQTSSADGTHIAVTPNGDCYVAGFFFGTLTFDGLTLPGSESQQLQKDVFLAKYNADGSIIWGKQIGNPLEDTPGGLTVDRAGNCYVTGSFIGIALFDNFTLTSNGAEDAFVAKYTPAGKVVWVKNIGGKASDIGEDIAVHPDGNLYLAGTFTENATISDTTLLSNGETDLYLSKWDTTGQQIFSVRAGGMFSDYVSKIALDLGGNAYLTGSFKNTTSFGTITLSGKGNAEIFVAKFGLPFTGPSTITISALTKFNYCESPIINIPFRSSGVFKEENQFVAQLSDANGSFASPIILGTGSKSPIKATIPARTPAGNGYKIRIIATSPALTSNTSEIPLAITTLGLSASLPNIITPNGDGLNDTFYISPSCLTIDLKVYNRWGKLVYERAKYDNSWGGTNLTAGIYYYQILTSKGQGRKGWVEISR